MKFFNVYHWLYAQIYLAQCKFGGGNHNAIVVFMSLMITLNLLAIIVLFNFLKLMPSLPRDVIPIFGISLMVVNTCYFFYKGRNKKILLEFDVRSKLQESYYYVPGLVYSALSFGSLFFVFYLKK